MRPIDEKKYSVVEIEPIRKLALENPKELVRRSEEYYNAQVLKAAKTISKKRGVVKIVLLCGPSASGKTTTAHKLKHRLIALGVPARVLSMDDFFLGMGSYPLRENGEPDMESVKTMDMPLLNHCLKELLADGKSLFPTFDFASQVRSLNAHLVELEDNGILIMEGIHALNPMVVENIDKDRVFSIYVSVRTKFVAENGETVLVPKDIRLMRRMVRDNNFRNYPPSHTLAYWDHVVKSERINIDVYRDDVDLKMDNTIDYEVCVWHKFLDNTMKSVNIEDYRDFPQLAKIFAGLMRFPEVDGSFIPHNSLLREFIGKD